VCRCLCSIVILQLRQFLPLPRYANRPTRERRVLEREEWNDAWPLGAAVRRRLPQTITPSDEARARAGNTRRPAIGRAKQSHEKQQTEPREAADRATRSRRRAKQSLEQASRAVAGRWLAVLSLLGQAQACEWRTFMGGEQRSILEIDSRESGVRASRATRSRRLVIVGRPMELSPKRIDKKEGRRSRLYSRLLHFVSRPSARKTNRENVRIWARATKCAACHQHCDATHFGGDHKKRARARARVLED